jgi:hypothetical protein
MHEHLASWSRRPEPADYPAYFERYIRLVPDGDILETLARQMEESAAFLAAISDDRARFRYAAGKWSVKEVVGHVIDSERVFAYRGLRFARSDRTPLPGFDENAYVAVAGFDRRPLADLAGELRLVRAASIALFEGLDEAALVRRGLANDREHVARSVPWIIAGHELHHLDVVRKRYLYTAAVAER